MKVLRNSNQQLLNWLEELKEKGTQVTVTHNRSKSTGRLSRLFIGRYKLFMEIESESVLSVFPADLSVIVVAKPKLVETVSDAIPASDTTARSNLAAMYKLIGIDKENK